MPNNVNDSDILTTMHVTRQLNGAGRMINGLVALGVLLIGFQILFNYASLMQQVFRIEMPDSACLMIILALGTSKLFANDAMKNCCDIYVFRGCR